MRGKFKSMTMVNWNGFFARTFELDQLVTTLSGGNGAGKSTLSYVLSGREGYTVTGGSVTLNGQDILAMAPHERAAAGLFLAFQYPVEIPGVQMTNFLKTAINAQRKQRGEPEMEPLEFLKLLKSRQKELGVSDDMMKRPVNVGFSGGEKKRNDILQMAVLQPKMAILDETDSGLDIDALRIVADGVNHFKNEGKKLNANVVVFEKHQNLVKRYQLWSPSRHTDISNHTIEGSAYRCPSQIMSSIKQFDILKDSVYEKPIVIKGN